MNPAAPVTTQRMESPPGRKLYHVAESGRNPESKSEGRGGILFLPCVRCIMPRLLAVPALLAIALAVPAAEPTPAEKGYKALTETAFIPGFWSAKAVPNAWKQWGVKEKPADYDMAFRERYGLHPAPYPNNGLPMGLRPADLLLVKGMGADCMLCHGGSILGKSYVGLGNSTLDIQALFEDLGKADGSSGKLPFTFTNVRGTNEADGFGVYLLGFRNPDLSL